MNRQLVIQTEHLDAAPAAWLSERCELVRKGADEHGFSELLARADGLVIRTYTTVDGQMLAGAPQLKVVGRAGVGLDNVDLAACAARGVTVCNTPDANSTAVVEYVLALMLDALRPRVGVGAVSAAEWKRLRAENQAARQLSEMTLGIWGMGRIGTRVARVAASLGMRVLYSDLLEIPAERRWGAEPVSAAELCARADVLTVHVDGRRSNRRLVGAAAFAGMKKDVLLINAARGFIVDAAALAAFLRGNSAARAVLDVHEPEPFPADYPLLGLPNARLLPHLASCTATAQANMSWVVRDVWRVLTGEPPEFPAAPELQ
ncbi:MAG TPA: NAD(P)-dependent oxidoreductase [Phycisphaerales bacterium]|nr:NAD(P)-dependent oxidoreductase [Phycisphaerales bacterium]